MKMNLNIQNFLRQSDNYIHAMTELRGVLIDRVLSAGLWLAIPGILASFLGTFTLGWSPFIVIGMCVSLLVVAVSLLRQRIPYFWRAGFLIAITFILAITEFLGWGLAGVGIVWLLMGVTGAIVFFNIRAAVWIVISALLILLVLTAAIQLGLYRFAFDFNVLAYAPDAWIAQLITAWITALALLVLLGYVFNYLGEKIRELSENKLMLEQAASSLQSEIAERKHTTRQLEQALTNLKQIDRMKDNFLGSVSHELRTPLANLKLYLQLSRKRPDKSDEYMQTLEKEVQRLEIIVEQMIYMAKIHDGKDFATWIKLDMQTIIETVMRDYYDITRQRNLSFNLHTIEMPPMIFGSREMLRELIRALIDNAVKYSPPGSRIDIRTILETQANPERIGFRITNTGVTIPTDEKPFIFDRFYRGKASAERQVPGAGLGLAAVREIVLVHQGTIQLEEATSQQVTFTVMLPAVSAAEVRHSA